VEKHKAHQEREKREKKRREDATIGSHTYLPRIPILRCEGGKSLRGKIGEGEREAATSSPTSQCSEWKSLLE